MQFIQTQSEQLIHGYVSNENGTPYYIYKNGQYIEQGIIDFNQKIICVITSWDTNKFDFWLENEKIDVDFGAGKYIDNNNVVIEGLADYKLYKERPARVFGDAYIYSIPTDVFSEVESEKLIIETIPSETDIVVQGLNYYSTDKEEGNPPGWYYTTYNDVNGWVKRSSLGFKVVNLSDVFFGKGLLTSRNLLSSKGLFVPTYTPINECYYLEKDIYAFYYYSDYVLFDYKKDIARKLDDEDSVEILFDGIKIYEQAHFDSNVVYNNIPVGAKLVVDSVVADYRKFFWLGVTYNDIKGWIYINIGYDALGDLYTSYRNREQALETFRWNEEEYHDPLYYPTTFEELSQAYFRAINSYKNNSKLITETDAKIKSLDDMIDSDNEANNISKEKSDDNVIDPINMTESEYNNNNLEMATNTNLSSEDITISNSQIQEINKQNYQLIIFLSAIIVVLLVIIIILLIKR